MLIQLFGTILRETRTKKGISQEKLAEYCDLDRTFISLIERGQRQPTLTTIFRLAKALEISPSELVRLTEKRLKDSDKK